MSDQRVKDKVHVACWHVRQPDVIPDTRAATALSQWPYEGCWSLPATRVTPATLTQDEHTKS